MKESLINPKSSRALEKKQLDIKFAIETIASEKHPKRNEDTVLVNKEQKIFGVFDGISKPSGGEVASRKAMDYVVYNSSLIEKGMNIEAAKETLKAILLEADEYVQKECKDIQDPESDNPSSPGTTASILKIHTDENNKNWALIANVGDSRVYKIEKDGTVTQITEDDDWLSAYYARDPAKRAEVSKKSANVRTEVELNEEEKELFKRRNVMTTALGDGRSNPHIYNIEINKGDRFFITSDGIHDNLTTDEIEEIIKNSKTPEEASKNLTQKSLERSRKDKKTEEMRAKPDDMSVVFIEIEAKVKKEERQIPTPVAGGASFADKSTPVIIPTPKAEKEPTILEKTKTAIKNAGTATKDFTGKIIDSTKDKLANNMSENILGLDNTNEIIKPTKDPVEGMNDFIEEFDLEPLLTKEFNALKEEQKVKVITDLKRRIVDMVKTDAETQYSETLKGQPKLKKIWGAISKEKGLKNFENESFKSLRTSKLGKQLITDDLHILTERARGQEIGYNLGTGEPYVFYLNNSTPETEKETGSSIYNFNLYANDFAKVPYEWGQEKSGKHKKAYDTAKIKYERAREEALKAKTAEETPETKGRAIIEFLEIDNSVRMEQLLNTHPEFEQALDSFKSSAKGIELAKNGKKFLKSITLERTALAGVGFGLRAIAKGAVLATGVPGITLAAAPFIGGAVGYLRGRSRAKSELLEKQKEARHGGLEEKEKGIATTNCNHLTKRLNDIMEDIEKADGKDKEEYSKKLAMLGARIDHTLGKIEKGQVDFETSDYALVNQYNLTNSLNRAITLRELSSLQDEKKKKEIDSLLETIAGSIAGKTSKAQKEFIKKQARKSMWYGASFALAGYGARYIGECLGWWGDNGAETIAQKSEVIKNLHTEQSPTPTPTTVPIETPTPKIGENITEVLETQRDSFLPIKDITNEGVIFENGKGGIQGILDLKKQILDQYNGDYSKAPQSVQDFMDTDATKQAIKLGLFDPTNTHESALIKEGSMLKFDENGRLLFGKPDASGNIPELEKYSGPMLDTDKTLTELDAREVKLKQTEDILKEKIEAQIDATTEENPPESSPVEPIPESSPVEPIPEPSPVTTKPRLSWFRKFFH